jgi:hypothetical protein
VRLCMCASSVRVPQPSQTGMPFPPDNHRVEKNGTEMEIGQGRKARRSLRCNDLYTEIN